MRKMSDMTTPPTKRSLILAGGGVKVAFQAGVLGMSGREIADNWRNLDPNLGIALNWSEDAKRLLWLISLHA